jgi:predicted nucleic acid-binding Zn ribbon protein
MFSIRCPECTQSFTWTDDMPLRGRCPNPDCEGSYDVRTALKQSVASRQAPAAAPGLACPYCGTTIRSRWTLCGHCRQIVLGGCALRRRDLLLTLIFALLALSLFVRLACWRP